MFAALTLSDILLLSILDQESHCGWALWCVVPVGALHAHGWQRRGNLPLSHPRLWQPGPPVWRLAVHRPPHGDHQLLQVRGSPHSGLLSHVNSDCRGVWEIIPNVYLPASRERQTKTKTLTTSKLRCLWKEILNSKVDYKSDPVLVSLIRLRKILLLCTILSACLRETSMSMSVFSCPLLDNTVWSVCCALANPLGYSKLSLSVDSISDPQWLQGRAVGPVLLTLLLGGSWEW